VDTVAEKTDQNHVVAEVYGAGNNARQRRPETRYHGRKKSETRVTIEKLSEAEVLFVVFLMIVVRHILRKRVAAYIPFFAFFFTNENWAWA
jgi:hypothetical protein